MDSVVSLPNSYVKTLILNMTVFGDRSFKEVTEVNQGPTGAVLVQ